MRETSPRGWRRWRITAAAHCPFDRLNRLTGVEPVGAGAGLEPPGPDGIRHELVARVRQQIADGTYDTEEKWALAEEALLRRAEGRR